MRNTGLDEAQAGIKIAGRNINNLRSADDTTLRAVVLVACFIHLEKEMATHSSTLAWKIPLAEQPGRLQSMGS